MKNKTNVFQHYYNKLIKDTEKKCKKLELDYLFQKNNNLLKAKINNLTSLTSNQKTRLINQIRRVENLKDLTFNITNDYEEKLNASVNAVESANDLQNSCYAPSRCHYDSCKNLADNDDIYIMTLKNDSGQKVIRSFIYSDNDNLVIFPIYGDNLRQKGTNNKFVAWLCNIIVKWFASAASADVKGMQQTLEADIAFDDQDQWLDQEILFLSSENSTITLQTQKYCSVCGEIQHDCCCPICEFCNEIATERNNGYLLCEYHYHEYNYDFIADELTNRKVSSIYIDDEFKGLAHIKSCHICETRHKLYYTNNSLDIFVCEYCENIRLNELKKISYNEKIQLQKLQEEEEEMLKLPKKGRMCCK